MTTSSESQVPPPPGAALVNGFARCVLVVTGLVWLGLAVDAGRRAGLLAGLVALLWAPVVEPEVLLESLRAGRWWAAAGLGAHLALIGVALVRWRRQARARQRAYDARVAVYARERQPADHVA